MKSYLLYLCSVQLYSRCVLLFLKHLILMTLMIDDNNDPDDNDDCWWRCLLTWKVLTDWLIPQTPPTSQEPHFHPLWALGWWWWWWFGWFMFQPRAPLPSTFGTASDNGFHHYLYDSGNDDAFVDQRDYWCHCSDQWRTLGLAWLSLETSNMDQTYVQHFQELLQHDFLSKVAFKNGTDAQTFSISH